MANVTNAVEEVDSPTSTTIGTLGPRSQNRLFGKTPSSSNKKRAKQKRRNKKLKLWKFGTINVQSGSTAGRVKDSLQEAARAGLDLCCFREMR